MKNRVLWGLLFLGSITGCTGMNNTQQGAVTGGALGAGIGALASRCHPLAGAAIGAGVGTLAGAAIGAGEDRRDERRTATAIAAANAQAARQMSVNDVVQMAQQGQSDSIIINQIASTGSVFQLAPDDVNYLHQQRVSDAVISYMQSRRYVVVQPRPVVVYERPYYPPPPGVAVVIR